MGRCYRVQTPIAEGRTRARTITLRTVARELELDVGDDELEALELERPRTRGACEAGIRPCPFLSCRYHLAAEVTSGGGLKFLHAGRELDELEATCALDVADLGGLTLEEVAIRLNVTRERVRQIEARAIAKLSRGVRR